MDGIDHVQPERGLNVSLNFENATGAKLDHRAKLGANREYFIFLET